MEGHTTNIFFICTPVAEEKKKSSLWMDGWFNADKNAISNPYLAVL